ncbi:MAG: sigma-70 family RNA polymerase sigma factor [Candidatus Dormibacteraeota bacterium]|nr:sigma-70 family RNA polymerase sigma factor [Candidatus Dormibacteraeota bacterium]
MSSPTNRALEVVDGATYADWESVYRDNVVAVYRVLNTRVGNRPDAEDLTMDVFLKALPRLRLPAPVPAARAYLLATARTVLADHWRGRYAVLPDAEFLDGLEVPFPDDHQVAADRGEDRARRLLSRLPENFRRVLELRFLSGYSAPEVAAELGLSVGNVRVLQFRALRRAAALAEAEEP